MGYDLHTRHGSILTAAEVTHALYCYGVENDRFVRIPDFLVLYIFNWVNQHEFQVAKALSLFNNAVVSQLVFNLSFMSSYEPKETIYIVYTLLVFHCITH